jgi:hypothetical protein
MKFILPVFFVLACGSASVQAATSECVAPVFPDHSTSTEGARRVDKQVKKWRACFQAHSAKAGAPDLSKLNAEVDAKLAAWTASTQAYSNGQAASQENVDRNEREKHEPGRGAALERARVNAAKAAN